MPARSNASNRLLWLALLFLLQHCRAVVTHIPSPNVCEPKPSHSIWPDWESLDCPPTAACVPIKGNGTYGYCSCSLRPEYHKVEDAKCVPSTHTKAFAVCLGVVCVFSFCAAIFGVYELVIAYQRGVLKFNAIFATGAISVPTMLTIALIMVCNIFLYIKVPGSRYDLFRWVNRVAVLFEGLCTLTMLLLFGLSINDFLAHSEQLRSVDPKRSRRIVLCCTFSLDVVLMALVVPFAVWGQWAIAALISGLFGLFCLLLYNRTLRRFIGHDDNISVSRSLRGLQTQQTLSTIYTLCVRLLCAVISFCVFAALLLFAWFVGRRDHDGILLGVVYSWAFLGMHASTFACAFCTVLFLRSLVIIRSQPAPLNLGSSATACSLAHSSWRSLPLISP